MLKQFAIFAFLFGINSIAAIPVIKPMEGALTYLKVTPSTAFVAIEGKAAEAVFDDMKNIKVQRVLELYVKIGKSTTCIRGLESTGWRTVCYLFFTNLPEGELDNSKRFIKP